MKIRSKKALLFVAKTGQSGVIEMVINHNNFYPTDSRYTINVADTLVPTGDVTNMPAISPMGVGSSNQVIITAEEFKAASIVAAPVDQPVADLQASINLTLYTALLNKVKAAKEYQSKAEDWEIVLD